MYLFQITSNRVSHLTRFYPLFVSLILFTIVTSVNCRQSQKEGDSHIVLYASLEEEEKLLLIKYVPLGITYEDVKDRFPEISNLRSEGGGIDTACISLCEAFAPVSILNRKANIEFNFSQNKLYSYYYWLEKLDCQTANGVYQKLQKFYSDHYGKYHEEEESEPGYSSKSSSWKHDGINFGMANNIYPDGCVIAWGYQ